MKFAKILVAALLVMLVFAVAPAAAEGSGTQADPYVVYYVGWSWNFDEWGMGNGTSMGNGSAALGNWTTYGSYSDVYTGDVIAVTSNKTGNVGNTVYYKHVYADLDTMWYDGTNGVPSHVTNLVSSVGYDYMFVDMFYSDYMNNQNAANAAFVTATAGAPAHKASIFSLNYNNTSDAPANFEFRDNLANSGTSQFASDVNAGLTVSGASATSANFAQYQTVLSYLN